MLYCHIASLLPCFQRHNYKCLMELFPFKIPIQSNVSTHLQPSMLPCLLATAQASCPVRGTRETELGEVVFPGRRAGHYQQVRLNTNGSQKLLHPPRSTMETGSPRPPIPPPTSPWARARLMLVSWQGPAQLTGTNQASMFSFRLSGGPQCCTSRLLTCTQGDENKS